MSPFVDWGARHICTLLHVIVVVFRSAANVHGEAPVMSGPTGVTGASYGAHLLIKI